jgi:hypothetical protein
MKREKGNEGKQVSGMSAFVAVKFSRYRQGRAEKSVTADRIVNGRYRMRNSDRPFLDKHQRSASLDYLSSQNSMHCFA